MKESERRTALACLAAVEANLAELRDLPDWWKRIGPELRLEFHDFEGQIRVYYHDMANEKGAAEPLIG